MCEVTLPLSCPSSPVAFPFATAVAATLFPSADNTSTVNPKPYTLNHKP